MKNLYCTKFVIWLGVDSKNRSVEVFGGKAVFSVKGVPKSVRYLTSCVPKAVAPLYIYARLHSKYLSDTPKLIL